MAAGLALALGPVLEIAVWRYFGLALLVALSILAYAAMVLAFGAVKLSDVKAALRRS